MNTVKLFLFNILLTLFFVQTGSKAQTCGFGCLGLSGAYAGYTYQKYAAPGLNDYVNNLYNLKSADGTAISFGTGRGFRLGANFFRAKFENYFLTAKGFYQFLRESQEISLRRDEGLLIDAMDLDLNYWGFGVDFGVTLFSHLDIKVIEGGVAFYDTELRSTAKLNNSNLTESKFESTDLSVGYYIGTGLIFHIIPDYLSVEGTAIFNILAIDKIQSKSSDLIIPQNSKPVKFIDKGGLAAALQLNLGVPL